MVRPLWSEGRAAVPLLTTGRRRTAKGDPHLAPPPPAAARSVGPEVRAERVEVQHGERLLQLEGMTFFAQVEVPRAGDVRQRPAPPRRLPLQHRIAPGLPEEDEITPALLLFREPDLDGGEPVHAGRRDEHPDA